MNLSPKKTRLPKAANGMQRVRPRTDDQEPDAGMGAVQGIGGLVATGAAVLDAGRKPIPDGQGGVVPEGGSAAGILGSTASGAATGAAAGPLGALAGGVIGAGIGVINYSQAEKDHAAGLRRKELFAQQRNRTNVGLDVASTSQVGQYKRGSKRVATKAIEIERQEPQFSAPGSDGRRQLKQYHPDGPTHAQGGIATIAAEGDAIVTAKGGKGPAAVAAHQRGDHATVEKLINQMPADKGTPKARHGIRAAAPRKRITGVDSVTGRPLINATPWEPNSGYAASGSAAQGMQQYLNAQGYKLDVDGKPGPKTRAAYDDFTGPIAQLLPKQALLNTPAAPAPLPSQLTPVSTGTGGYTRPAGKPGIPADSLTGGLQAAPTLYNLGQGLFGNVEKTTRRGYSPELQSYQDLSGPQRQASRQAMNSQISNARNLSGGNAGNVRANANAAFAEDATRQGAIDAQESGRRLAIGNQNTETRNSAAYQNARLQDGYDNLDLQNAAKKQEALSKGLEGIGGLASQSVLTKNTLAKEAADRNMLGQAYKDFGLDKDMNVKLRARLKAAGVDPDSVMKKGRRSIKVK